MLHLARLNCALGHVCVVPLGSQGGSQGGPRGPPMGAPRGLSGGSWGALRRVLVRSGHYHTERDPGRWEYRRVRVCRDGYRTNNVHLSYFH